MVRKGIRETEGETMTENQREEMTLVLKGVSTEAKRTVYIFMRGEREYRVSGFNPNLPTVQPGKTYTFTVEHVPTGDGRFYHNLAREKKDGPYLIKEVQEATRPPNTEKFNQAMQTQKDINLFGKDDYWEKKNKRDEDWIKRQAEKEPIIEREACMKVAAPIVAALISFSTKPTTKEDAVKLVEEITLELERFAERATVKTKKPVEAML